MRVVANGALGLVFEVHEDLGRLHRGILLSVVLVAAPMAQRCLGTLLDGRGLQLIGTVYLSNCHISRSGSLWQILNEEPIIEW